MDLASLVAPISADSPGGSDARYEPEFAALLEETEKLNSISHSHECNWAVVEEMGIRILQEKAKDFQAATYLAHALSLLHGPEGTADGAELLHRLVDQYWETGFPVLRRLRGRVNAFDWWRDCTEKALDDAAKDRDHPVPAAQIQRLRNAIRDLDSVLGQKLPDFPSLRNLLDRADRLPILADPEPVAEPAPAPAAPQAPASPQASAPEPAGAAAEPARPAPAPVAQAAPAQARTALPTPPPLSEDVRENRKAFLTYAKTIAEMEHKADPADPVSWQLTRFVCWANLRALPPAQGRQTALPAPAEELKASLQTQLGAGLFLPAALAAENLCQQYLYWLDLHCIVSRALAQCGPQFAAARAAVDGECATLLRRLPGVEDLCFNDGTPFADAETKQWLAGLSGQGNETALSPAAASLAEARRLFATDRRIEALDVLDRALVGTTDQTDRLSLRLEQCRLLIRAQEWQAATVLAEELMTLYTTLNLPMWSRDLALDLLQTARQAWEGLGNEEGRRKVQELLAHMVRLRPSAILS